MRRHDSAPLEPDIAAALAAIDATLDGEPVEPEHAGLAELALILREQRPELEPAVARALDERVRERTPPRTSPAVHRSLPWRLVAGPAAALAALALVVVVAGSGGGGASSSATSTSASATSASAGSSAASAPSSASSGGSAQTKRSAPMSNAPFGTSAPAPRPAGHRQVVQSSRLTLSAAPDQIDDVAQRVFDVVDSEHGYVESSHVTATGSADGLALFQLTVPSTDLQATVAQLSRLRQAHVISRTDDTSDITGQVGGAGRRLADARALRRSLLARLAAATSSDTVAALQAQLRRVNATIGHDEAALNGLHRQVQYSNVAVTIQATAPAAHRSSHGAAFTLGRARHDAGRVLVIVAGVTLIALAVLVPLGLVVAVVAWLLWRVRRHRREAALDLF